MTFEEITDLNFLYQSFMLCKKECSWKESIQKYEANILLNLYDLQSSLRNGTYKQKSFTVFTLNERGKTRKIKALHISDRVVQKSLCRYLLEKIKPTLIYDNGASLKNKGISFSRKRFKTHLHRHFQKNGLNGYILFGDFSKFFDNIPHKGLFEYFKKFVSDERILNLIKISLNSFNIDVSFMTDREYEFAKTYPVDSLKIKEDNRKEKFLDKGVGIGSELSQIAGIGYPTFFDNLVKIVFGLKYYGRYMDDFYIIHESKDYLKYVLGELKEQAEIKGLFINEKKTHIVNLKSKFSYLKHNYRILENGKIIETINNTTLRRLRRKFLKYAKMIMNGQINKKLTDKELFKHECGIDDRFTIKNLTNIFKSYVGTFKKVNSFKTIEKLKGFFYGKIMKSIEQETN